LCELSRPLFEIVMMIMMVGGSCILFSVYVIDISIRIYFCC